MAEDISESFHSFGAASTSSFRIVHPGSELPPIRRSVVAPSLTESQYWDNHDFSAQSSRRMSMAESERAYDDGKSGITSSSGPRRIPVVHTASSSTVRPTAEKSGTLAASGLQSTPAQATKEPPRVLKREVWRDILLKSTGRDKAFKLIQYSIRVYLWFHLKVIPQKYGAEFNKRLNSTASGLSLTRKCLILGNWLTPLIEITNPSSVPFTTSSLSDSIPSKHRPKRSLLHRFIHASPPLLIDMFCSLATDVHTLFVLGLLPRSVGRKADRVATWLWFVLTLAGLVEVETDLAAVQALQTDLNNRIYDVELDPKTVGRGQGKVASGKSRDAAASLAPHGQPNNVDLTVGVDEAEEGLEKLQMQSRSLKISRWKLYMDLIFTSYLVFRIRRFEAPALALSGLASAALRQERVTPWDNGEIQPPLRDFIESNDGKALLSKKSENARALVPGCGTGYDAAYFASLGYEALGADLSSTAVQRAKEFWAESPELKSGKLSFQVLDFFKFEVPATKYDLVYDCSFFCALPPELRAPWGARMRELVRPGGTLITLVYPIDGSRTGGPPYSIDVQKVTDALQGSEEGSAGPGEHWTKVLDVVPQTSIPHHVGRERLVVWERL
ncbi:hypothetical protein FRC01_002623 [Tulasnella sp. 417]|nr:hypothetical protein FRC01_002623 [Tulasnella sp. 417]